MEAENKTRFTISIDTDSYTALKIKAKELAVPMSVLAEIILLKYLNKDSLNKEERIELINFIEEYNK